MDVKQFYVFVCFFLLFVVTVNCEDDKENEEETLARALEEGNFGNNKK